MEISLALPLEICLTLTARQVIDEQQSLTLSHQEREQFLALLEHPPKPTPRLVKAMQHYLASR